MLRRLLVVLCSTVLAAASCIVLAPLYADQFWILELPGHFRGQASLAAALATLGLAGLRATRYAVAGLVVTAIVAAPVIRLWLPPTAPVTEGQVVRLLSLNVSGYLDNQRVVVDLIRETEPTIVGLIETSHRWSDTLQPLAAVYPYRGTAWEGGVRSGAVLLSRVPLESATQRPLGGADTGFLVATLTLHQQPVALALLHAAAPVTAARRTLRNTQFDVLAGLAHEFAGRELVMMGDFNTSPWSAPLQRLMAEAGLRNAAVGFGFLPTWPAETLLMGVPIDHCLVSDGLAVRQFGTVGPTGSDHLAIFTDLVVP